MLWVRFYYSERSMRRIIEDTVSESLWAAVKASGSKVIGFPDLLVSHNLFFLSFAIASFEI
jgi:hypothetical protein